jgi:hypothetical protein
VPDRYCAVGLIAEALPASRRHLVSRPEAAPNNNGRAANDRHASEKYNPALYMLGSCSAIVLLASSLFGFDFGRAWRQSTWVIRNISESRELESVYTFRGKQK